MDKIPQEIFEEGAPVRGFSPAFFALGARRALPIVMGYLPVAFAFGVLATSAGLSPLEAGLMGLLVFAGSGQLIAANLMLAGFSPLSIITTTFVVNSRHLLMSAAMTPFLRHWSKKLQAWYCFEMTDETFAMNIATFAAQGVKRDEALGVHATAHLSWISGGILGAVFGNLIGDLRPYGLDYALAGMFIALIMPHLKIPRRLAAALLAGVASLLLDRGGLGQWSVIIATAGAATVALFLPIKNADKGTVTL